MNTFVLPTAAPLRSFSHQGKAAVLLEADVGGQPYVLKAPRRRAAGGESMTAREVINWRLARGLGLPVPDMVLVEMSVEQLSCHRQELIPSREQLERTDGRVMLTATERKELVDPEEASLPWGSMSEPVRAALAWHETLVTFGDGDRLRVGGARDVFELPGGGLIVLDFESLPSLWDRTQTGGVVPTEVSVEIRCALLGVSPLHRAAAHRAAVGLTEEDLAWADVVEGVERLVSFDESKLRAGMKRRLEGLAEFALV
jgi:hypothetical protein